jgi:hypothetical protein
MTGEVIAFDPSKFAAVAANLKRAASTRVGFLKMDKTGTWSYGTDENRVSERDHIFIDPNGFVHGWQCWADTDIKGVQSELLDEAIAPMDRPLPDRPDKVLPNARPYNEMRGMSVLLKGERLVYSTTSVGGINAFAALAEEYMEQFHRDPKRMIAEVSLTSDSYKHKNKTYGRIYTPIFNVVAWHANLPVGAAKPEPVPAPAKKAAAPAKKAAKPKKAA